MKKLSFLFVVFFLMVLSAFGQETMSAMFSVHGTPAESGKVVTYDKVESDEFNLKILPKVALKNNTNHKLSVVLKVATAGVNHGSVFICIDKCNSISDASKLTTEVLTLDAGKEKNLGIKFVAAKENAIGGCHLRIQAVRVELNENEEKGYKEVDNDAILLLDLGKPTPGTSFPEENSDTDETTPDVNDALYFKSLYVPQFQKTTDELHFEAKISGKIDGTYSQYTLGFYVDNNKIGTNTYKYANVTNTDFIVAESFKLEQPMALGAHTFKIRVESVDHKVPSNPIVKEKLFRSYGTTLGTKKHLIELHTATWCPACPRSVSVAEKLQKVNDKAVVVAVHCNDDYKINQTSSINNINNINFYPTVVIDRAYNNLHKSYKTDFSWYYNLDPQVISQRFNELTASITTPSLVSIDIKSVYDKKTRVANVKISTQAVQDFEKIFGEPALYIYLVEDKIKGKGKEWNNVLRAVSNKDNDNNPFGIPMAFDNNMFNYEAEIAIDKKWNPENMRVVAFVGRKINNNIIPSERYITNVAEVSLIGDKKNPAGITTIDEDVEKTEVARYNARGEQLSGPMKGLNVIRYSDGTIKKEIR